MKCFVGVQFDEPDDKSIALVSNSWITPRKKEVYWPPCKYKHQFDRKLCDHLEPDETWKLYKISRCFFEDGKFII